MFVKFDTLTDLISFFPDFRNLTPKISILHNYKSFNLQQRLIFRGIKQATV